MAELLLDSAIRFWVFMPIVVITFFVGMLRHYISIITTGEKPVDRQQLADRYELFCFKRIIEDDFCFSQALIRTRLLRENGKYIPKEVRIIPRERESFFYLYFL